MSDVIFKGKLCTDKPVNKELYEYINKFAKTTHVRRDPEILKQDPNWKECAFCGLGEPTFGTKDAAFFAGYNDTSIQYYIACETAPSKHCNWYMTDLSSLEWNGASDNKNYFAWLDFLIQNFFKPCGYILNGSIHFSNNEDSADFGCIVCKDNVLQISSKMSSLPPLSLYSDIELEREIEIRKKKQKLA